MMMMKKESKSEAFEKDVESAIDAWYQVTLLSCNFDSTRDFLKSLDRDERCSLYWDHYIND